MEQERLKILLQTFIQEMEYSKQNNSLEEMVYNLAHTFRETMPTSKKSL